MNSDSTRSKQDFEFSVTSTYNLRHGLQVLSFKGTEQISSPFSFEVTLVSDHCPLSLDQLLHEQAFVSFNQHGAGVHGQINRIVRGETGGRLTHYYLTLVPRLDYLRHRINTRIFQHKTVEQIIGIVLQEHGIFANEYCFLSDTRHEPREYCTQYNETDLQLVQRLCAEEGIYFRFQHSAKGHETIFCDEQSGFPRLQTSLFKPDAGMVGDHPTIKAFSVGLHARSNAVARRDYTFEYANHALAHKESIYPGHPEHPPKVEPDAEDYRWPGHLRDKPRGQRLTLRALERHRLHHQLAEGVSDDPQLMSGHVFELTDHPDAESNRGWLLNAVTHEGKQPQVLEEFFASDPYANAVDGFAQGYRNHFYATPGNLPFRPPFVENPPYIHGSESAIVTGPKGEEIYCDEYGRIKVQFFWDRDGQGDDRSSCWLRVASNWAGGRYGSVTIPRVGMEVVVAFFRGDPDQPYVAGCLPNSSNQLPYPLPQHKSRSVFKTASYPGALGANELRIEDSRGQEEIYLHAQRNLTQVVKNDHTLTVGNLHHTTITGNSHTEYRAEEHRITHADRKVSLMASDHLSIAQSQHVKAAIGQFVEAGQELHYKAGNKVVIDAGVEMTLTAGGHFITVNPAGIFFSCNPVIGGAPVMGSGAQVMAARVPTAALGNGISEVPSVKLAAAEERLFTQAEQGHARCPVCEACREQALSTQKVRA